MRAAHLLEPIAGTYIIKADEPIFSVKIYSIIENDEEKIIRIDLVSPIHFIELCHDSNLYSIHPYYFINLIKELNASYLFPICGNKVTILNPTLDLTLGENVKHINLTLFSFYRKTDHCNNFQVT